MAARSRELGGPTGAPGAMGGATGTWTSPTAPADIIDALSRQFGMGPPTGTDLPPASGLPGPFPPAPPGVSRGRGPPWELGMAPGISNVSPAPLLPSSPISIAGQPDTPSPVIAELRKLREQEGRRRALGEAGSTFRRAGDIITTAAWNRAGVPWRAPQAEIEPSQFGEMAASLLEEEKLRKAEEQEAPEGQYTQRLTKALKDLSGLDLTGASASQIRTLLPVLGDVLQAGAQREKYGFEREEKLKGIMLDTVQNFRRSKEYEFTRQALLATSKIRTLLRLQSSVGDVAATGQMPYMEGQRGQLSDRDIGRYTSRWGLVNKFTDITSRLARGILSADQRKELLDTIAAFDKSGKQALSSLVEEHGSGLLAIYPEMNADILFEALMPPGLNEKPSITLISPQGNSVDITDENELRDKLQQGYQVAK